ncbi:MAG: 3-hydroxyacyl-CoA dehydrogenase NAD-binding domain-containing protein [Saprospiraceae bacterium]|nr:3-hydroxyacyl-CoA dehydrogenase NAD-binding domain-containing protein [Saprospiraceae bacterium]
MRHIKKVAVLGSGIMGSGIACHLANVGMEVLLLDILPFDLTEEEKEDPNARNRLVNQALSKAIKSKPAPLYRKDYSLRIHTGNFEDDLSQIADCDWIIEVIIEQLDIKQQLFEKVDTYRRKGTLVSSNTSGIPIHLIASGRSDDFRSHFCGTHFFNPPRYLELLEIIPTEDTSQEVIRFFMQFGDKIVGKSTVLCKDTPAFIANRVGVFAMARIYELAAELKLTIQDVDKLTGPALSRPKSGTFRLADLVGHDTAAKVTKGFIKHCPNDDQAQKLTTPTFVDFLLKNEFYGNKSGQGFYKKTKEKDENGKSIILGLNLQTLEYESPQKSTLDSLQTSKQMDNPSRRVRALFDHEDRGGQLVRKSLATLFAYVSKRVPEISEDLHSIDTAMRSGYAWGYGPFEYWDLVGLEEGLKATKEVGETVAPWIQEMISAGFKSFYTLESGQRKYFDLKTRSYQPVPGTQEKIHLDNYREKEPVFKNDEVILHDIGDGVLCLEFRSKMNAIGEGILTGINEAIAIAEQGDWIGIVIGNNAKNFTVGANLMMIGMLAFQQEFDQLNMAVKLFQDTTMRCRYSPIPVVVATQGYVFGGGCEISMHADSAVCAAESYIGLVEVGVGLLPGGGGTKEFAVRASDAFFDGDVKIPTLIDRFRTIALAQVATSAPQAYIYDYLQAKDAVVVNTSRVISEAKKKVLDLAESYVAPSPRKDIQVLGRSGLGALYSAASALQLGKYASEHDILIANKVAFVLCGGDLTGEQLVSEQYLLDLEREAFLSLCGEQKTMERIQYMLENNKPLRN